MNSIKRRLLLRKPMYDFLRSRNLLPSNNYLTSDKEICKFVKQVSKLRPKSNELIDQCPISDKDLVQRIKLLLSYLGEPTDKEILFVGDDDLASAVLGNISSAFLTVIDIDKNILLLIENCIKNKLSTFIKSNILDIIDRKIEDPIDKTFNAFVTDPPYTEMGYKYFLDYGIKHLNMGGLAFIAVPYMNKEEWSNELLYKVETFLMQKGLVIIEILPGFAEYMHDDAVLSSMIVAKKVSLTKTLPIDFKRAKTYTTGFEL